MQGLECWKMLSSNLSLAVLMYFCMPLRPLSYNSGGLMRTVLHDWMETGQQQLFLHLPKMSDWTKQWRKDQVELTISGIVPCTYPWLTYELTALHLIQLFSNHSLTPTICHGRESLGEPWALTARSEMLKRERQSVLRVISHIFQSVMVNELLNYWN